MLLCSSFPQIPNPNLIVINLSILPRCYIHCWWSCYPGTAAHPSWKCICLLYYEFHWALPITWYKALMLHHQCEVPVKFWNTKPIFFHFCSSRFLRSIQSLFYFSRSSSLHSAAIIFWTRFNPIPACQVFHQLFGGSCLSSLTPNPFFNSGDTDTSAGWP